ncbi:hydrolase [Dokdonia sinensis]|uniref:Hydrolase n=1 Tax=Dokdonia sinensis TaxID=2479847 RepID=A0A3M0G2C7_9FLAO|nr:hydrolase [Dokdonia sinensis]RMB56342.1 hydrolase [Dokdonia sinensis]
MLLETKIIAVDFDGTIVENAYPSIGKPLIFAFDTLKKLQSEGHQLILWTYRTGKPLEDAVAFCAANGLHFYAVNKSYPEEVYTENISRKINADVFIDDRDVTGMKGWGEIYHILSNKKTAQPALKKKGSSVRRKKDKKGFFSRIEELFKEEND